MSYTKMSACPELGASRISRLFFLWSKELEKKTEEKALTEEGLWDIHPRDRCENVCPAFDRQLGGHITPHNTYSTSKEQESPLTSDTHGISDSNSSVRHRKTERTINEDKSKLHDNNVVSALPMKNKTQPQNKLKSSSLLMVILRTFWRDILHTQSFRLMQCSMFWITNPHFMSYLMDHNEDPNSSTWIGVVLSLTLLLLLMIGSLAVEHSFFTNNNLEMHIQSALMTSVYKKAMNLSSKARKNYSIGEMTNYMSSDCDTIAFHLTHINQIIFKPLHFVVVFYQLFQILGSAAFLGLLVIIIITPINVYVAVRMRSLFDENAKNKDEKMKLLNEVLTGIKVLKLHAWEKCFGAKLDAARNKEVEVLRRLFNVKAFTVFSWNASPYVISVVMFCGYFYLNDDSILTAKSAFTVVSLMNLLRYAINETPEIIFDFIKANVAIKRIQNFLFEEEHDNVPVDDTHSSGIAIDIVNATFAWDVNSQPTLKSVDLSIAESSLVAVVGQVGAGKSSLVSSVLGEIEKVHGHLGVKGSIAYVSQQAWIQNDTLQNNILFGKSMDITLYRKVIKACALQPDIDLLSAGDRTEIGERGINLSGGQKQRVSLARAVYSDADIYLMDDPLSAVDSHVRKHIFDNVIGEKGLLRDKTRVLVTHNVRYLPEVDNIIVMDGGRIVETGSFMELLNSDGVFTKVLKSYLVDYEDNRECLEDNDDDEALDEDVRSKLKRLEGEEIMEENTYKRQISRQISKTVSRQSSRQMSTSQDVQENDGKCIEEEEEAEETSKMEKWNIFVKYSKAFGLWNMWIICIVYGLYYVLWTYANIWLVKWTEDPILKNISDAKKTNSTITKDDMWRINMMYLSVYSGLGIVMCLCILVYAIVMTWGVVKASRDLHHKLLMSILRSPMEFFDTTPIGRITSRFSKDMNTVDNDLPFNLEYWLDCALNITVAMFAVAYSTPSILGLMIPLAVYYYSLQKQHTKMSGFLRSLESKTAAPIESCFTESVMGADTVRAYRAQNRFLVSMEGKVDNNHRMLFYNSLSHRWLGLHMLFVGNVVCATSSLLRSIFKGARSAALLALGTTFSVEINGCMGWFVILQSLVETEVISVDRITKYINSPNEANWRKSPSILPHNWPEKGKIEFQNYSLRYRQSLDLVLQNISITVKAGEKIGVVGRTGAGKSSLMLSLFRLVEPAEGAILIDGVDIADIGLHDLREKLAIIPQDPVLFTGSLKMNLDPEDKYTEEEILKALDHTHLRQFVDALPEKLQSDCGEGGTNFSVGQRQLFCLTRTLLRKAKILVLDEATAAVDMETDDMIQQTIRSEFKDCTVMTIAHRLNTVMDYDRILVMDVGSVVEFDTPTKLLQNKGVFHQMTVDAGLLTNGHCYER